MISIHRKITFAFSSLAVLVVGVAALAFLDLLFLERQVEQGITITTLETAIQDMRREEKNLFLYQDVSAGQAADTFAATALQTLQTSPQTLAAVGNVMQVTQLQTTLQTYRQLLASHLQRLPTDSTLESSVREQGHLASQLAESLTLQERRLLNTVLADAKWAQVLGVGILSVLLVLIGWLLDRSVITPMKRLMADRKRSRRL
ncbi:hypothetical protein [Thiothrix fructosivorans]|uniref:Chemotaxis methyl-accepting receptor HlyB-like 4HB MCP domain-containing protein n=1 Tax=Thiothrix fructosivorans TaxID=111770 RepID=A0ABS3IN40_9GAMM|nr:hypothetical protein [Thiothrix fructosivorans]MBO0613784.1 hypothetical protein [Thiothrix fructosivorans]